MTSLDLPLNGHLANCICHKCGEARKQIELISNIKKGKKSYKGKFEA